MLVVQRRMCIRRTRIIIYPSMEAISRLVDFTGFLHFSWIMVGTQFKSEGAQRLFYDRKSHYALDYENRKNTAAPKWFFVLLLIYTRIRRRRRANDDFLRACIGSYFWCALQRRHLACHTLTFINFSTTRTPRERLKKTVTIERPITLKLRTFGVHSSCWGIHKSFNPLRRRREPQTTNCNLIWCMISQHLFRFIFSANRYKLLQI